MMTVLEAMRFFSFHSFFTRFSCLFTFFHIFYRKCLTRRNKTDKMKQYSIFKSDEQDTVIPFPLTESSHTLKESRKESDDHPLPAVIPTRLVVSRGYRIFHVTGEPVGCFDRAERSRVDKLSGTAETGFSSQCRTYFCTERKTLF